MAFSTTVSTMMQNFFLASLHVSMLSIDSGLYHVLKNPSSSPSRFDYWCPPFVYALKVLSLIWIFMIIFCSWILSKWNPCRVTRYLCWLCQFSLPCYCWSVANEKSWWQTCCRFHFLLCLRWWYLPCGAVPQLQHVTVPIQSLARNPQSAFSFTSEANNIWLSSTIATRDHFAIICVLLPCECVPPLPHSVPLSSSTASSACVSVSVSSQFIGGA